MRILLSVLLLIYSFCGFNQSDTVRGIMERGIELHEKGQYELSLVEYRKALKIEPKSAFVNYEMALSYYYMGNKSEAESFAKVAAKEDSESGVQGVILLGSLYDEQGKSKKSIKTYKSALKRFGDYYLIWFNLGVTYSSKGDQESAAHAFEKALSNKLDHSSSHYALGTMHQIMGNRSEALIPMYFFLLLEPDSDRSSQALTSINDMWRAGVDDDTTEQISITLDPVKDPSDPMEASELFISLTEARKNLEENRGKSEFELHKSKLTDLINYSAGLDLGSRDDYYTQYYIPFFRKIAQSEHMEAFMHYILQSQSEESRKWVVLHTDELEAFFTWLDESD